MKFRIQDEWKLLSLFVLVIAMFSVYPNFESLEWRFVWALLFGAAFGFFSARVFFRGFEYGERAERSRQSRRKVEY